MEQMPPRNFRLARECSNAVMHLAYHLALVDLSVDASDALSDEDKPRDRGSLRAVNVGELKQAGPPHLPAVVPVQSPVCTAAFQFDGIRVGTVPVDGSVPKGVHPLLIGERPTAHVRVVALSISFSMTAGILGCSSGVLSHPLGAHVGRKWPLIGRLGTAP